MCLSRAVNKEGSGGQLFGCSVTKSYFNRGADYAHTLLLLTPPRFLDLPTALASVYLTMRSYTKEAVKIRFILMKAYLGDVWRDQNLIETIKRGVM